jgi:polysaccharide biosynthesis/export protein
MFKTKKNYPFDDFSKLEVSKEYKIGLNDVLEIQISSNKGASIIEGAEGGGSSNGKSINTFVEFDGSIKLPILGRVPVKELTIRNAELLIEERLKQFYVDPYVIIKITNKRVIIFPGEGGNARVLTLLNNNTNLLEALAASGGISANGKANRIKIIRGDLKNPQVFLIDLSTIEGMKKAEMTLQGNDIIYIEGRNDYVQNFLTRINSYLALFNLGLFIYSFVN